MIGSLHHLMRSDPRRRFSLGMTIEKTKMRVWLCHHSATVVCEALDFVTVSHPPWP